MLKVLNNKQVLWLEASLNCLKKASSSPSPWALQCALTIMSPMSSVAWWLLRSSSTSPFLPRLQLCTHTEGSCVSLPYFAIPEVSLFSVILYLLLQWLFTTKFHLFLYIVAEHCIFPPHILSTLSFLVSCPISSQEPGIMAAAWNAGHSVCYAAIESVRVSRSHGLPNSVHSHQNKWSCDEEGVSFLTPEKG